MFKITLDIYPIHLWLEVRPCPNDSKTDKFRFVKILTSTINFMTRDDLTLSYLYNKIIGL